MFHKACLCRHEVERECDVTEPVDHHTERPYPEQKQQQIHSERSQINRSI
jgi:hypothetical protein